MQALGINANLKSGHPSLEFTNTVGDHASEHPEETLFKYEHLIRWGQRVGILGEQQAQTLLRKAASRPDEAAKVLSQALELREATYRIFVALIKDQLPAEADLAALNEILSHLTNGAQLVSTAGGFTWKWNADENALEAPLWTIALSAVDLLTSEYCKRVGQCAGEKGCGWLFVDTSKNHSRRWCDINDCGNRAKQRRYQERARRRASAEKS